MTALDSFGNGSSGIRILIKACYFVVDFSATSVIHATTLTSIAATANAKLTISYEKISSPNSKSYRPILVQL